MVFYAAAVLPITRYPFVHGRHDGAVYPAKLSALVPMAAGSGLGGTELSHVFDPRALSGGRAPPASAAGVRVPSAAAPFCTSGVFSRLGCAAERAGLIPPVRRAEILIGNILLVASDPWPV